jgi:eukaryotic-like serine/threonine-protein kinase
MANAAPGEVQYEPISLAGKYDILPDMPLPALNGPGGPAYAVRGIRERRMELFALVCNAGVPPRMEILSAMRGVEHPAMMRLLDFGVVDWTPDGSRRLVLILEKPGGKQLMPSLADTRDPMPEDQLTRLVLLPLCSALKETSSRGIVHGDVRPTNLFIRENGGNALMLGECVSGLPSYTQPIMILTIERAMAQPGGRGSGTVADDLYALGVTALILLLGRNPVKQLDDDQVLQAKVDRGSYPALAGSSRVSISLMEPLRGL